MTFFHARITLLDIEGSLSETLAPAASSRIERRAREFFASNIIKRRQLPRAIRSSLPPERPGAFLLKSGGAGR
jgi:hypothetical protein